MPIPRWRMGLSLTTLLLGAGCIASRAFPPPTPSQSTGLMPAVSGRDESHPPLGAAVPACPRTILAISGGGSYGAYAAGVLKGWSASGERPQFDVVTGVSTGALIAPFAFLGSDYDAALESIYTTTRARDVFRRHSLPRLLWSDAVAVSTPLRRQIEASVTPETIEQIARAHLAGRRLYVGTTNLDTKRPVIWDLGAIAAGDDPDKLELFRNVLLASASVPGLMPPVPIDIEVDGRSHTELHVDGGVSKSAFVEPFMLGEAGVGSAPGGRKSRVYVLVCGKLAADAEPVPLRFVDVTAGSLSGLLLTRLRDDLQRIYRLARETGADFGLAAMPEDFPAASNSVSFDPRIMRRMFDEGYRFGASRAAWCPELPGADSDAPPPPRTGIRFHIRADSQPRAAAPRPSE